MPEFIMVESWWEGDDFYFKTDKDEVWQCKNTYPTSITYGPPLTYGVSDDETILIGSTAKYEASKKIDYEGGMEKLAEDIGNLRYDALRDFLRLLGDKIYKDSVKDLERDRRQLAVELYKAGEHIRKAWVISEPHMPKNN